jgi:hypothetical protein
VKRVLLFAAVLASVFGGVSERPAVAGAAGCGSGSGGRYAYAGHQADATARGIRATVTPLAAPHVATGHVAAWVGVGGPGDGPNGTDEWLQVGIAALPTGRLFVYSESERSGEQPRVLTLRATVDPQEPHRLAIAAPASRPDEWQVWVDGIRAGAPVVLPGSNARWRPIATTESWSDGGARCNSFAFRFDAVEVASRRDGAWIPFVSARRLLDPGFAVHVLRSGSRAGDVPFAFVAETV